MDYVKAFIICGAFACLGSIVLSGPRRFFSSNHPFQAAATVFVLGGIVGAIAYPLLAMMGGEWRLWK